MNLLCYVYSPKDDLHIFQFKLVFPCFLKHDLQIVSIEELIWEIEGEKRCVFQKRKN